jgi:hypothetical protein
VREADYTVAPINGDAVANVQSLADLYAEAKLLPVSFQVDFAFNQNFLKLG